MRTPTVLRPLAPLLLVVAIAGCSYPPEVLIPPAKETPRTGAPALPPPAASIAISEPNGEPNGEPTGGVTGEVTLDLKDVDLTEALKSISRQADVNVIADPEVKEKVTIQLERVDLRSALKVIARQTRCKIVTESDRLIRLTQPPSISMEFQDADIKTVIQLLAKQAGANIIIGSDVQGKVTLSLRDVPWMDALDAVAKTGGYVIVREGNTPNWRVMRP